MASAPPTPDTKTGASNTGGNATPSSSSQEQGRGGRGGRGGGRSGRNQGGRGNHGERGRGNHNSGRGPQHGRGGNDGPVSVAPSSGIPYGHVPAYLPGSSSLVEELDKRVLLVLRDGRHLVGIMRSFDQFSNMVLEEASERIIHHDESSGVVYFADVPLGVYIVRGESMVLLGQVRPDEGMKKVEKEELDEMMEKAKAESLEWDFDKDLLA